MAYFKQGDKIKVIDTRTDAEKSRNVIGQGERNSGYIFQRGSESCNLQYGEVFKVSTATTATFVNRDHSLPLINSQFANDFKIIFELVEAPNSDEDS